MCERCHVLFMAAWRARDAASERGEAIDAYRDHVAGAAAFEQDDDEQLRRSAA